jgi:hypothetical protein
VRRDCWPAWRGKGLERLWSGTAGAELVGTDVLGGSVCPSLLRTAEVGTLNNRGFSVGGVRPRVHGQGTGRWS